MADFEIVGTVVQRGTRKGVQGIRVEAWDRDTRFHDMLGSTVTDGAGRFRIRFTDDYFGDYAGDRLPDVFYRVFRDETLILSTQDHPSENEPGPRITVTLEIDPLVERKVADDRISAKTAINAINFLHQSDFRGIGRDAGDRVKLAGSFIGRALVNGFKEWNWKPVGPSSLKQSDVVNRDTQTAQAALAAQNVTVERVEPYNPTLNRDSARQFTALPTRLAPGDRVVLYEEDGTVRYYSLVKTEPAATIDQAEVSKISSDMIDRLTAGLADMRAELAQRDQTIAGLQAELTTVKASQDRITQTDLLQRLDRLESRVG